MIHEVRIQNVKTLRGVSIQLERFTIFVGANGSGKTRLQVLATAHSPYLLNYVLPEQVRIMALGAEGHARCGRLTDHPKFATWKEEMAPGELWSLFGENWL